LTVQAKRKTRDEKTLDAGKLKLAVLLWRDLFVTKYDADEFSDGLEHFIKAFGDKQVLEIWYNFPKEERECVRKAKEELHCDILGGRKCIDSPQEALKILKQKCPKSADSLQQLFDMHFSRMKEFFGKIIEHMGKLPNSVQNAFKTLFKALKNLHKDCNFLHADKVWNELIPFLEQFLSIPQADLEKFAELCPDMEPVLVGDLKKYRIMSQKAMLSFFKTGDMSFAQHVNITRAIVKLDPFRKEKFAKTCQWISESPEQALSDQINAGIEEEVEYIMKKLEFLKEE